MPKGTKRSCRSRVPFKVKPSEKKERKKCEWPKDQRHAEACLGRSATVASHVLGSGHRGHRKELEDQPAWHGGRLRAWPTPTITRNRRRLPVSAKSEAA